MAIHLNDIGTELVVLVVEDDGTTPVDLSAATVKQIKLKPPGGTLLTKTAVLDTTGTNGLMKYVTVSGDLSAVGPWQIEGYVETAAGKWNTDIDGFTVLPNLT